MSNQVHAEKLPMKMSERPVAIYCTFMLVQLLSSVISSTICPVVRLDPWPPQMAKSVPEAVLSCKLEAAKWCIGYMLPLWCLFVSWNAEWKWSCALGCWDYWCRNYRWGRSRIGGGRLLRWRCLWSRAVFVRVWRAVGGGVREKGGGSDVCA